MTALGTALAFAKHGHAVFPANWPVAHGNELRCSCGSESRGRPCRTPAKHPFGKLAPNGVLSATTDTGIIKHWFGYAAPEANLGVGTDKLIVIDADPRHDGDETLAALILEHGDLPLTWRVLTGGGGEHVIFRCPDGVEVSSSNAHDNPVLGPGIDIRARGGYIIAPPSHHISGRCYEWSVDHHPRDLALAEPPAWILDQLVKPNAPATQHDPKPSDFWSGLMQPIAEYRDDAACRIAGHLFACSCDFQLARGLMHAWNSAWCKPPLAHDELNDIIERIAKRQAAKWRKEAA
jgi:hypothetical protein